MEKDSSIKKILSGQIVPLYEMSSFEERVAYKQACNERFVMTQNLDLAPVMVQDIWYQLNPEHSKFRSFIPEEPKRESTITVTHGVQSAFHPFGSHSGRST